MFDIGFPELLLVSVIALVVIGPEKLPETIRTLSLWLGRLKRSLATIKSEIEAEIGADDIRRQLREESVLGELKDTKVQLEEVIDTTRKDLTAIVQSAADGTDPDGVESSTTKPGESKPTIDSQTEFPYGNSLSPDSKPEQLDNKSALPDSKPELPDSGTDLPNQSTDNKTQQQS
jgi:sec-independent protein translocase protein TatB|tara:strand:- start:13887 stop:14411 length:525 start_codon:yes stop_codon:yes gene_type:complete